jgi:DNA (cytosine-5)-methyltransferase 1
MNVLSLFDGMSCGRIALERAGIKVDRYYSSEIKEHAIKLVKERYPDTIHIGNVINVKAMGIPCKINILIGGSPCKGISKLNQNQEGLIHDESILFWQYLRILNEIRIINPDVKFILENVPGQKEAIRTITKELGVRPIKLNSSLVSAQNRVRLYWTNILVTSIPKNKHITTSDVLDNEMPEDLLLTEGRIKWLTSDSGKKSVEKGYTRINPYPKSGCITANGHRKWNENYIYKNGQYRYLSIRELERLQTLPEGYCDGLTYDEAYDLIGDGWTIDIISHILKHIK